MGDPIADAAARLLALMGHGGTLWQDRHDDARPLSIGEYTRQALADAALEQHRRAREGWA